MLMFRDLTRKYCQTQGSANVNTSKVVNDTASIDNIKPLQRWNMVGQRNALGGDVNTLLLHTKPDVWQTLYWESFQRDVYSFQHLHSYSLSWLTGVECCFKGCRDSNVSCKMWHTMGRGWSRVDMIRNYYILCDQWSSNTPSHLIPGCAVTRILKWPKMGTVTEKHVDVRGLIVEIRKGGRGGGKGEREKGGRGRKEREREGGQ